MPTLGTQGIGYQCERRNRGRRPNGPNSDYEGSIARRILHAPTATSVVRNFYRDSVALMQLSAPLGKLPGIRQASAIMASEANRACCTRRATHEVEAGPNDLLIAIEADSDWDPQFGPLVRAAAQFNGRRVS